MSQTGYQISSTLLLLLLLSCYHCTDKKNNTFRIIEYPNNTYHFFSEYFFHIYPSLQVNCAGLVIVNILQIIYISNRSL